jgi:hypothetical protein
MVEHNEPFMADVGGAGHKVTHVCKYEYYEHDETQTVLLTYWDANVRAGHYVTHDVTELFVNYIQMSEQLLPYVTFIGFAVPLMQFARQKLFKKYGYPSGHSNWEAKH